MGRWMEGAYKISRDLTRPDQELPGEDAPEPPPRLEKSGD
jgi:hypothetical protein